LKQFTVIFYGGEVKQCKTVKTWTRTSVQNLVRHKTGRYYARLFGNGKESWKSLGTDVLEVAKIKLRDVAGDVEKVVKASAAHERGRMTVGDCAVIFKARLKDGFGLRGRGNTLRRISDSSIHYREQTLAALFGTWPDLEATDVRKVSTQDVEQWARKFSKAYSATRYNNTLDTLRALLELAIDAGARVGNPAQKVGRVEVKRKSLVLPEPKQFTAFVESIRTAGAWCSKDCADFVQFLAFTGARKEEAANVLWSDVDLVRNRVHLRVTKGSRPRYVPLIADAKALLSRMRSERAGEPPSANVLRVKEAQKAMDNAAKAVGMSRITHHDLRHLFATACIEAGVVIPTVAQWMGHKDGGVLAMKTYGHLRDEHSTAEAKRVSFSGAPVATNIVPMPEQVAV
jgi:integrase